MADEHVKRLPVVDSRDTLVGIVSRRDLLRIHLRADDDIREAVTEEVLWQWFRVRPPQVVVEVQDGVVTLSGELERKRQVSLAVHVTRAVDGVVDVVNRLACRIDDTYPALS
jgi:osmotically-inducible protein OsmY